MKCQYCGGTLSLEAKHCPHCGRINIHAQQHIRDMRDYQGAFADTQNDVYRVARNHSGITVRAVLISVLLLLIVVLAFANTEMYSIKYDVRERQANLNAKQYREILDGYLEEENYQAFGAFCDAYNIRGYMDEYIQYSTVIDVAREYSHLYRYVMELCTTEDDYGYKHNLENIGWALENLYVYLDEEDNRYGKIVGDKDASQIVQSIQEKAEALLIVYCGLTEEEAAGLKDLSSAKRIVLIEENIQNGQYEAD